MIRIITEEDADWLYERTLEFNDKYYSVPLNESKTRSAIDFFINHPAAIGFRSDGGYIAGVIEEDPFRDWVFLCERGWFSKDRSGIKLLDTFIEWASDNPEINEVRMGHLASNPGVQRLLSKRGFKVREVSTGMLV